MKILRTDEYEQWLRSLKDKVAFARIAGSTHRWQLQGQVLGDIKPVGDGVNELRIHAGPGYRVYFAQKGSKIVLLLIGGTKKRQSKDIEHAKDLLARMKEQGQW